MSNIRFLGFSKQQSSVPVFGLTIDKSLDEQLKAQVPKVLTRLKELSLRSEERQRIKSQFGVWFCKKDDKGFFYFAQCTDSYPQRHIYAAINELRLHLTTIGDYASQPDVIVSLRSQLQSCTICQKYNNTRNLDKIGYANSMITQIKDDLSDSTRKLLDNQVNLQGLNKKAADLRENAQMFEVSAGEVQRQMYCRNCKLKIIIAIVIIALICVIVIPIVATR